MHNIQAVQSWTEPLKYIQIIFYFWIKDDLDRSTMHTKFDPTEVRTHDLQIMTVHFMSLIHLF